MNSTTKRGLSHAWLVFLALCLTAQAWAAPEYVTAWPKQVPVEKPDPVLGDKQFLEFWVYGEAFAKRFKGFPVDKAGPELRDGLKALALRIYKENLWAEINPNYPEQYACEVDAYFDSSIVLPLAESGKPRHVFPAYPSGVSGSFKRLEPVDEKDAQAIRTSKPAAFNMKDQPLIFAAPLDGRHSLLGVREYHPNLAPGLSYITLLSPFECSITAPPQDKGSHWLSLRGENPYNKERRFPFAAHGTYTPNVKDTFDPGPSPESKGYFRVPEAFNKAALPKAILIKTLNWCIRDRYAHEHPVGKGVPADLWQQMALRCEEAEHYGRILPDPRDYPDAKVLRNQGY
jgi:hypothetical protein